MPNGLAFGGQMDYWALYISPDFDKGCSKAHPRSTTYNSPRLSQSEEFKFTELEVWLVKEKEVDDRLVDPKKMAMTRNPEAQALLEMAGKELYAKAIGERSGGAEEEEDNL